MLSITASNDFHQDKESFAEHSGNFRCAQEGVYWPQDLSFPTFPLDISGDFSTFSQALWQPADFIPSFPDLNESQEPAKPELAPPLPHRCLSDTTQI